MRIRVLRDKATDKYTLSEIFAFYGNDVMFSGFGVENPWMDNQTFVSCIPAGTYKAFTRVGSNGNVIELEDVPGRTHIQFHVGNTAADVDGCIAVGMGRTKEGVSDSAIAMRKLYGLAEGQDITVEVMDMVLPQRKGDEIQFGIIDPAEIPVWRTETPAEWLEPVSYSNTLAEFKSALRERFEKRDKSRKVFNLLVSVASRVLKVPELNMLQFQTLNEENMTDIDISKKIQKIISADGWEAIVWLAVAVLALAASLLTGNYELIAGAGAAGIKAGFQWYKAQEDSSEEG